MKILNILFICLVIYLLFSFKESQDNNSGIPVGTVIYSIVEPNVFLANYPGWAVVKGQKIEDRWEVRKFTQDSSLPDLLGKFVRSTNIGGKGSDPDQFRNPLSNQESSTKVPTQPFRYKIDKDKYAAYIPNATFTNRSKDWWEKNHKKNLINYNWIQHRIDDFGQMRYHDYNHILGGLQQREHIFVSWGQIDIYSVAHFAQAGGFKGGYKPHPSEYNTQTWVYYEPLLVHPDLGSHIKFNPGDPGGDKETRPVNISLYTYIKVN